mmetsp:Transcript_33586/g.68656  ORF Transcript_33586/g.68656 Transcript_33586/m.68656 type:complete len:237 (-) Transcript_33586:15-725(-)
MQQLELEIEVAIRSGNSSSSFAQEPHVRHKEKPLHISLRRRHGSGGHVRVGGGPGGGGACNRPHGAGVRGRIARRQAARKGRHRLGPLALDVMRQGRPFVFWKLDDDVKVQDGRETKQDAGDLPDHVKAEAKRGEEHQEAETAPRRVHEAKVFRNGCCNRLGVGLEAAKKAPKAAHVNGDDEAAQGRRSHDGQHGGSDHEGGNRQVGNPHVRDELWQRRGADVLDEGGHLGNRVVF